MKRKTIIKGLTIMPHDGSYSCPELPLESDTHVPSGSKSKQTYFRGPGIHTFINAMGTYTTLIISFTDDEVSDVIDHGDKKRMLVRN